MPADVGNHATGDVERHADEAFRPSVGVLDRRTADLHPASGAVRADDPVLYVVVASGRGRMLEGSRATLAIVRMHRR